MDQKGQQIMIHYTIVNNYLKDYFGKTRRIKRTIFLSEEQITKRKKFF